MPLSPKLVVSSIAKDASSITLHDTTGVYNVTTNPGGYGAPNPVVPTRVGLTWRYWPNTALDGNVVSDGISLQVPYTLSPVTFGKTGKFSDGVHHIKYHRLYGMLGSYTLTNGSTLLTRLSGTVNLSTEFDSTNYTAISILDTVYEIDFSKPLTATSVYLKAPFSGTTGTFPIYRGLTSDIKILIDRAAQKVFAQHVHKMSTEVTECNDSIETNSKILIYLQAAPVQMRCRNYTKAHELISYVRDFYSLSKACCS